MKNKIKGWAIPLSVLGVLIGGVLNQVLTSNFGSDGFNIVVTVLISIELCAIVALIIMSEYFAAMVMFIMSIPMLIMVIGTYLDNDYLSGFGILLIFIIYPILIKVMPKLKRGR